MRRTQDMDWNFGDWRGCGTRGCPVMRMSRINFNIPLKERRDQQGTG